MAKEEESMRGMRSGSAALALIITLLSAAGAQAAIRPGFDSQELARNDDGSTGLIPLGFTVDFFGLLFSSAYVNNNGNITFDAALSTYTPFDLTSTGRQIIAPFFADVDTRLKGNPVRYGNGTVDGRTAWGATWADVDCYSAGTARLVRNYFQVVLVDRSDTGPGNFDVEFNFDQIQWEAGQASGGTADCLGGNTARVGYSNGSGLPGTYYELPGSGSTGAFLDSNPVTGLVYGSLNTAVLGRYLFFARNGVIIGCDDADDDGLCDDEDNCPSVSNVDQADFDSDGQGDVCDADDDNDGVLDASDNCPYTENGDQADNDLDMVGDVCDPDDDNDGYGDGSDNCPFVANNDQFDFDGDGQGDACDGDDDGDGVDDVLDNCPLDPNPLQEDLDGDGQGDACDPDDDNDLVIDLDDNCPETANTDQADLDADNIGDACDADIDGDGVFNDDDNCVYAANTSQDDTDFDGDGDACDPDDDNDGVLDEADNCQYISNASQADLDGDGQGDPCDGDLDGDGVPNDVDNCAWAPNSDQSDFDGDGDGDACDSDVDGDGVENDGDLCAFTPLGAVVDAGSGCSIDQLCPCAGPRGTTTAWKNHGQYVSCMAHSTNSFRAMGLISETEKGEIMSAAGAGACGKK